VAATPPPMATPLKPARAALPVHVACLAHRVAQFGVAQDLRSPCRRRFTPGRYWCQRQVGGARPVFAGGRHGSARS
jgi:hypothetical protein